MSVASLAAAHRRELETLTRLAGRDLALIWDEILAADAVATRQALLAALPDLVSMYGSAAATLGADFYDELRDEAKIAGRFRAVVAELPDAGRTTSLARWGIDPLFGPAPNPPLALDRVTGGLQRIVANADRQTVMGSSVADPKARGWKRVTSGGCDFCRMLAGRGAVYSESTADFTSHDHCHCFAAPAFG